MFLLLDASTEKICIFQACINRKLEWGAGLGLNLRTLTGDVGIQVDLDLCASRLLLAHLFDMGLVILSSGP